MNTHQRSFNAGELTPLMLSRTDSEKYSQGAQAMLNLIPTVQGPVCRRPGIQLLGETADTGTAKLVGFNFSTRTSFVLEFRPNLVRFWSNGISVPNVDETDLLRLATPFSADDLDVLQWAQINDLLYIADGAHMPQVMERRGDQDWRIRSLHESERSYEDPTNAWAVGSVSAQVLDYWYPTAYAVTNLAQADDWMAAHAPDASDNAAQVPPVGALTIAPARIQRMRSYMHVVTGGTYAFRVTNADDLARMRISVVDDGTDPATISTIIEADKGAGTANVTTTSAYVLASGHDYMVEFVMVTFTARTSTGLFQYRRGAGAWESFVDTGLKEAVITETAGNAIIDGWPAMLDANATDTTLTPSAINGQITLAATADVFEDGNVGSYWELGAFRDESSSRVDLTGSSADYTSDPVRILGAWDFYTYGNWTADLIEIQRRKPGSDAWETIRNYSATSAYRNIAANGVETTESDLRIKVTAGIVTDTGAFYILEAADTRIYGLVKITEVTDARTASAYVVRTLPGTAATQLWAEGAWSERRGYPRAVTFYEQRLFFGGTISEPQRLWGSAIGDFETFQRGTLDDAAVDFVLAAAEGNPIEWLASQTGLIAGTTGDEWLVDSGSDSLPITPTSVRVKRQSRYGSQPGLPAITVGDVTLFVQRGGYRIREFTYSFEKDGWVAPDLTLLSEHLPKQYGAIVGMAHQSVPMSILWIVTANGWLLGMTYEREQRVVAWHRHLAVMYQSDGVDIRAVFQSVATIYGDETDEIWFCCTDQLASKSYVCRFHPETMRLLGSNPYDDIIDATWSYADFAGLADHTDGWYAPWILETMPLTSELRDGTTRGRDLRLNRVSVEILESSTVRYAATWEPNAVNTGTLSDTVDAWSLAKAPLGLPGQINGIRMTGELSEFSLNSRHQPRVSVLIGGRGVSPVTITGLVAKWEAFGD